MKKRLLQFFCTLLISFAISAQNKIVVFQSDFGLKDGAVSAMKGVAMGVDTSHKLFDLTHEIPAYNIWDDLVIYDVDGIKYFLTEFQKEMQRKATPEEAKLIDDLLAAIDQSIEFNNTRKSDPAMKRVQDMVDMIKGQDLEISPKLLSGISDYQADQPGDIRMRNVTVEENIDRRNYRQSDNIDYRDGDIESSIYYENPDFEGNAMYDWGKTTLVNDRARVFKGASWADRIYWVGPSTRRFLDERQSTATIGFRCAMTRVGSPVGLVEDKRRKGIKR